MFQYLFEKIDNLYKYEEQQLEIKKKNEEYKANKQYIEYIETLQGRLSKIKDLLDTLPKPKIKKLPKNILKEKNSTEALKIQKKEPMKVKEMKPIRLFNKNTKDCKCIFENKRTKEKHLYYALNNKFGIRTYLKIPIFSNKLVTEDAVIEKWKNNNVIDRYNLDSHRIFNKTLNLETLKDKSIEIIK